MKKLFLSLLLLSFSFFVQAQETASFHFSFNHLALCVKDVDRSVEFYKKVLSLQEITNRTKVDGIRWMSLGEGKELHLISIIKEPFTINKAIHLGLSTPDFDAFISKLDELSIPYSDWPGAAHTITTRADGVKQIYFQDPDGYWIEVNNTGQK